MTIYGRAGSGIAPQASSSSAAAVSVAAAVAAPTRTMRLPSGLLVRHVSKADVPFLYNEIYRQRCYLRHGLSLPPGGTVLDVGANIGMFAMFAAEELGPQGLVVSCEPLLPTYDCLTHNAAAHRRWWPDQRQEQRQRQRQQRAQEHQQPNSSTNSSRSSSSSSPSAGASHAPAEILALNVGVGDGSQPSATFTFYPRAAGWSSMLPSGSQVLADMEAFLDFAFSSKEASRESGVDPVTAAAGRWLRRWTPSWLYGAVWRAAVTRMLGGVQTCSCPMVTVSQLIREHHLAAVDLLKVDVERAELAVLQGVEDCHWPLVRQAVLEVHESNLEPALDILRGHAGFDGVVVEQEAALAGSSLYSVYCRRL